MAACAAYAKLFASSAFHTYLLTAYTPADGPANQSYGLEVAKLAGVPAEALRQARTFLALLSGLLQADTPKLILLVTIRSDSYELLQTATELEVAALKCTP